MNPNFLIVCTHGNKDDHADCDHSSGCSRADRVAFLPWFPHRPGWWPAEGIDERGAVVWPMEGVSRADDAEWMMQDCRVTDSAPSDERRHAIEIACQAEDCTTWAYRSGEAEMQTLLERIAHDQAPCTTPTCGQPFTSVVWRDDRLIVVTLLALHVARKHAQIHYRLLA